MSSTHRDSSPPAIKQEPDEQDSDEHYHHRKHRYTTEHSITSPTQQQQQQQQQVNNGHKHGSHTPAATQWTHSTTSPIQPIRQLDPLQAEVETLRKHNLRLQAEVAALQEKLKATSIHSTPPTASPLPVQHSSSQQHSKHASSPPTLTPSPSAVPAASASPSPQSSVLTSPTVQSQPPVTPVKEEAEVTQTANVDGRSSCHRCKSQKDNQQLMFCTYRGEDGKRTKVCRKKYCRACLQRWHMPSDKPGVVSGGSGSGSGGVAVSPVSGGATTVAVSGAVVGMGDEYEWWQPNCRLGWCCPACLGCCKCAACQRKYQWDVHVTSTAAAAGNGGVAGEEEIRKDVMERLQEQAATRFRTLKTSGALQRSPVATTTKERKLKPSPVTATPSTSTPHSTHSPTLSSASLHDGYDRDTIPTYALPASSPALSVHSRSESSTSLSSLSHPLTAEQTRQLLLNLRQGTLGPAQVAQLQMTLETQLQQMGGGGSHYGSSDEEKGSPTHSPYPESERDSPLSRASLQSYQSHATTHSAHSAHSAHPYYHSSSTHHGGHPQPSSSQLQQQPYHIAAISIPPSMQPQPPGLISPLSGSGYEQGQYGYGQAAASGSESHKRSDSRGAGRKRSSGSGHDYVPTVAAHPVPAVTTYHPPPSHSSQQAAYAPQPPSPAFGYPNAPATVHPSHQQYQQQQQSSGGYSSQSQQSQQPYSAAQSSHSPQQSYARITSPHTSHSQQQQHGPTQSQSHPQLSAVAHGNSTANSAYGRESHTQAMHNMRDHVLASRQQPIRSPSTATSVSPPTPSYPPPSLSPPRYPTDPYYLQSPVQSLPFPQLNPPLVNSYQLTSPYPRSDSDIDALSEWPLSPSGLGSVEEGDVVTMMNESSVGGSGRGLGGGSGNVGDEMQLSGMSLGAAGTMPLSLRADTFTPPTQD